MILKIELSIFNSRSFSHLIFVIENFLTLKALFLPESKIKYFSRLTMKKFV